MGERFSSDLIAVITLATVITEPGMPMGTEPLATSLALNDHQQTVCVTPAPDPVLWDNDIMHCYVIFHILQCRHLVSALNAREA